MKTNSPKFLTGLISLAMVFGTFTSNSLVSHTFFFKAGTANQRIETGFANGNTCERSISPDISFNPVNWTDTEQGADTWTNDGSSFIKSFDISGYQSISDGDNTNGISLSEALSAIASYFSINGYPQYTTVITIGSSTISSFTKADNANCKDRID